MQADPNIQAPLDSQSYNRYAYVRNNPMSMTDPSGYFFKWLGKQIKKYWKPIVAAVAIYFTAGAATSWVSTWGATWGTAATAATAATLTTVGTMAVGAMAGAAGGFVGGALASGSLKGALKGALTGALTGAAGGFVAGNIGDGSRLARGLSGGLNGLMETGNAEGFARGFLAGQIDVDLGLDIYSTNQFANFAINRIADYSRGYIIGGSDVAKKNLNAGLVNDGVGHAVGLSTSYYAKGEFSAPKFRNGMYYYDKGGRDAITIGNVITGPNSLYRGRNMILDQHERKHFYEQRALGPYYLPLQGISAGLFWLTGRASKPVFDCKPFMTTTYSDLGINGC